MMKTKKGYLDLSKKMEQFYEFVEQNIDVGKDDWESDEDLTEVDVKPGESICFL